MYGESWDFPTPCPAWTGSPSVVAIRSHHVVWPPPGARQRYNRWQTFDRLFADAEGTRTPRFMREVVFGRRKG
ncbi:MAG TPA: hypothetical protein VGP82_00035 [Ktedonobacterales bacterium]|jgi:SRSO17 transposase|nr:hypothetical protein [Ktedonobacterales bacterium]